MKKILVIEDVDLVKLKVAIQFHILRLNENQCDVIEFDNAICNEFFRHELKDVVEFETTVLKIDWSALDEKRTVSAIVNPPNVKPGDKLQVWFVVKQCEEEPDDQKS